MTSVWPVAILGSGDIAVDLMLRIARDDGPLRVVAFAGTDPGSDGLAHAARLGIAATAEGVDGLLAMPDFAQVRLVFDATSTVAPPTNRDRLADTEVRTIDLTPASVGPFCVPAVNLDEHLDAPNLNMVTCGGQAAVPIVAAIGRSGLVSYAEAVSAISSAVVGPDTRAGLDKFTESTTTALRVVGGADRGKAVTILNPAVPPVAMRSTVYCLVEGDCDHRAIEADVLAMVGKVKAYVPGYRLKQRTQFETFSAADPLYVPETGKFTGTRVTALLEIAGAADHLPVYAGNLDIMTAAAKVTAERVAFGETSGLAR